MFCFVVVFTPFLFAFILRLLSKIKCLCITYLGQRITPTESPSDSIPSVILIQFIYGFDFIVFVSETKTSDL